MGGAGAAGPEALTGGALRVGWIGSMPRRALPASFHLQMVAPVDHATVLTSSVDVWVVEGAVAGDRLRDSLFATGAPVVARVSARGLAPWRPHQVAGRVDVVPTAAPVDELVVRVQAAAARGAVFTALASQLAMTVAHDLRSPLQGIRLVLMALEREGVLSGELAEDADMLLSASETIELQLHGLYNLGRKPAAEAFDVVDLGALGVHEAARRPFRERVRFTPSGALHVRANAGDLAQALLDVFRVGLQLCPNGRTVEAGASRVGDVVTLRVEIPVWPPVVPYAEALLSRDLPLLLRATRTRLPFACLPFARDVFRVAGGELAVRGDADREVVWVEARLPAA